MGFFQLTGVTVGEVKAVADMHQRKAEMAKHSDAFIALPGWYKLHKPRFSLALKYPKQIMKTWRHLGAFVFLILESESHPISCLDFFSDLLNHSSMVKKSLVWSFGYCSLKGPIPFTEVVGFLFELLHGQKKLITGKAYPLILLKVANQEGLSLIQFDEILLEVEKGIHYHDKLWNNCTLFTVTAILFWCYMWSWLPSFC